MQLCFMPLLAVIREIYHMPIGWDRFGRYVGTILSDDRADALYPPLIALNPMAKPHVTAAIEALIALDAEAIAAATLAEINGELAALPYHLWVGFTVVDDVRGGWTDRYLTEMQLLFPAQVDVARWGWITVQLRASETYTADRIRQEVRAWTYRTLHALHLGDATTLGDMLRQEGRALRWAALPPPALDAEELAYAQAIVAPHLLSTELPTQFACLYGDAGASHAGYPQLGLSEQSGFTVAWHAAHDEEPAQILLQTPQRSFNAKPPLPSASPMLPPPALP